MPAPPRTPRGAALAALALIALLAAALRLTGLGFGLPHQAEPDPHVVGQVLSMRDGLQRSELEATSIYPHLVARLTWTWSDGWRPLFREAPLEAHLANAARPNLHVRRTVALVSVLIVPGAYALARAFAGRGWALFAALLCATSLLHQNFSQQGRPHAAAAALVALALAAAVRLRRRDGLWSWILAGASAALAVASLQSALAVLPALAAAWLLRPGGRLLDWRLAIPAACLALSLWLFWPYLFAGASEGAASVRMEGGQLQVASQRIDLGTFSGRGFAVVLRTLAYYEPVLLVLSAAGIALFALRLPRRARGSGAAERRADWRDVAVVLAFALPYLAVIGLFDLTYERFVLPLVAVLAALSAWTMERSHALLARLLPARRATTLAAAAAAALLLLPAFSAARVARLRASPDTATLAARWLEEHARAGERILAWSTLDLPLAREASWLAPGGSPRKGLYSPWLHYQGRYARAGGLLAQRPIESLLVRGTPGFADAERDPLAYLRSLDADWFVVPDHSEHRMIPAAAAVLAALPELGELAVRLPPGAEPGRRGLSLQPQDPKGAPIVPFVRQALGARATGPVLEIWRVGE